MFKFSFSIYKKCEMPLRLWQKALWTWMGKAFKKYIKKLFIFFQFGLSTKKILDYFMDKNNNRLFYFI